jgi:amino acid transporter
MTILLAIMAHLAIGIGVAALAKHASWIDSMRWWHVAFWPLIPLYWALVLVLLWMGGRNR